MVQYFYIECSPWRLIKQVPKTYLGVDPCKGFSKAFRTTSPVINENKIQNTINLQYDMRTHIIHGITHKATDVTTYKNNNLKIYYNLKN
jgi:hypothetical protein